MEENPDNKAFGLEVICYNAETNPEKVQTSNYKYCVGSSLKPKLVKAGRILIKLRYIKTWLIETVIPKLDFDIVLNV